MATNVSGGYEVEDLEAVTFNLPQM